VKQVFQGWWVVAGVFVMLTVTAGFGFYGLPVYLRALTLEQGFSVGAVSGATGGVLPGQRAGRHPVPGG
jgi:hypothetical protein